MDLKKRFENKDELKSNPKNPTTNPLLVKRDSVKVSDILKNINSGLPRNSEIIKKPSITDINPNSNNVQTILNRINSKRIESTNNINLNISRKNSEFTKFNSQEFENDNNQNEILEDFKNLLSKKSKNNDVIDMENEVNNYNRNKQNDFEGNYINSKNKISLEEAEQMKFIENDSDKSQDVIVHDIENEIELIDDYENYNLNKNNQKSNLFNDQRNKNYINESINLKQKKNSDLNLINSKSDNNIKRLNKNSDKKEKDNDYNLQDETKSNNSGALSRNSVISLEGRKSVKYLVRRNEDLIRKQKERESSSSNIKHRNTHNYKALPKNNDIFKENINEIKSILTKLKLQSTENETDFIVNNKDILKRLGVHEKDMLSVKELINFFENRLMNKNEPKDLCEFKEKENIFEEKKNKNDDKKRNTVINPVNFYKNEVSLIVEEKEEDSIIKDKSDRISDVRNTDKPLSNIKSLVSPINKNINVENLKSFNLNSSLGMSNNVQNYNNFSQPGGNEPQNFKIKNNKLEVINSGKDIIEIISPSDIMKNNISEKNLIEKKENQEKNKINKSEEKILTISSNVNNFENISPIKTFDDVKNSLNVIESIIIEPGIKKSFDSFNIQIENILENQKNPNIFSIIANKDNSITRINNSLKIDLVNNFILSGVKNSTKINNKICKENDNQFEGISSDMTKSHSTNYQNLNYSNLKNNLYDEHEKENLSQLNKIPSKNILNKKNFS